MKSSWLKIGSGFKSKALRDTVDDIIPALPRTRKILYHASHSLGSLRSCRMCVLSTVGFRALESGLPVQPWLRSCTARACIHATVSPSPWYSHVFTMDLLISELLFFLLFAKCGLHLTISGKFPVVVTSIPP